MNERNPTDRFSDRVDNYVRYRPTYPPAALKMLRDEAGLLPIWRIADLGSGSGISSELFLNNGNQVYGVEPNGPMRAAAERLLRAYPNFTSVAGSAEATTLSANSVDAVVAAQAFHWFDVAETRTESLRILKPYGLAILMWNTRRLQGTPFLCDYEQLLVEHGIDYQRVRHDRLDPASLSEFFGGPFTTRSVPNQQRLNPQGLRGRLESSSYVPAIGAPGHHTFIQKIDQMFQDHQQEGEVVLQYDTELHFGIVA